MKHLVLAAALFAVPMVAAGEPSEQQLAKTVAVGGLAALAPLCGLRDQDWSADLRRSTIQSGTGTGAHDDAALKAAPGSNLVIGALSYAETEATEDFAETPGSICSNAANSPILPWADEMVRRFRARAPAS
ncbi:MAG: hypothetical protein ACRYGM_21805 [Janthinobacterium lividum]